jgi:hypothetical protein
MTVPRGAVRPACLASPGGRQATRQPSGRLGGRWSSACTPSTDTPGWSSGKSNSNAALGGIPGGRAPRRPQAEPTVAGAVAVSIPLGVGVGSWLVGVGLRVVGVGLGVVGVGVGLGVVGVGVGVWVGDLAGLGLGEAVFDFDGFGWPVVCRDALGRAVSVPPVWAWRS